MEDNKNIEIQSGGIKCDHCSYKDELISAEEKYIELLVAELNEVVGMAPIHGWQSTRVKQGQTARNEIQNIKAKMEELK